MEEENVILTYETKLIAKEILSILENRLSAYRNEYATHSKFMPYDSRDYSIDKKIISLLDSIINKT